MFSFPPREKEWVSWLYVGVWTGVIYLTIPFARFLQRYFSDQYGRGIFRDLVYMGIVLGAGAMALYVVRLRQARSWKNLLWLGGSGMVLAWYTAQLKSSPEEALHFLEYGALGLLLFRALSHRVRDPSIYISAILGGTLIGTMDEIIQWVVPRRYWDFRDVWLNSFGVLLIQVAIWKGISPAIISCKARPRSIRLACALGIACSLLLGVCLCNTPAAVEWYTADIPALAFLRSNLSTMAEYGYYHDDPGLGGFYSRLTREELIAQDRARGPEVRGVLEAYSDPKKYVEFLETVTAAVDPFAHEARIHLFRRDHYMDVLPKYRDDPEMETLHATVAFRENQLLETYFSNTMAGSSYVHPRGRIDYLEKRMDPAFRYVSPVSAHLITCCPQWVLLAGVALLVVVLAGIALKFGKEPVQ
ncbi:MAG: VanZ family protein [Spartobacteria bacterium]|nr:VanZ family protein [Spartobacteria bacterium]